ncbi:N-acetylglucosamine-6-phosphate deacetylase [Paracoccus aestuarii]|uniref:N-acetylglucosamine-6-phosphate deacetylase n=1 Tax=Paracoccus aestuarii TaxID=453842 RepID=A0A418ZSG4_9RHOB|nr:N-acetylglucosamine-6-phosphate deacetylase [Paracoccus aestuarii]WCR01002.1 N-acetylglucosamine-6-phosphate deacetylase [Paracoccus aestuarii]
MAPTRHILTARAIFDGRDLLTGMALIVEDGCLAALTPAPQAGPPTAHLDAIIAPGLLDLQVNGGAGVMVGADMDDAGLAAICAAHRAQGVAGILPTLITDRPEVTRHVIETVLRAVQGGLPGLLGLHLEGPHLDPRRHGAHDPALIRPMGNEDLAMLCAAARALPCLMVTVAPEAATPDRIAALRAAGAVVSLGHSGCTLSEARAGFDAGAGCVTHLFNAMSPMGHREPGLVGATLAGEAAAGLIADGIHVDPAALTVALRARPRGLFLVSDCMAFAGSDLTEMELGGRRILRRAGRLTLTDGTLAGADLTLARAVGLIAALPGGGTARALAMATSEPAAVIGRPDLGRLTPGMAAEFTVIDPDAGHARLWRPGA